MNSVRRERKAGLPPRATPESYPRERLPPVCFPFLVSCSIHPDDMTPPPSPRPDREKVECHNRQALLDAVLERGDRGLLTVSNHMCVYDDPGLWSALLPFWR